MPESKSSLEDTIKSAMATTIGYGQKFVVNAGGKWLDTRRFCW
jgi:hypothetical protein